MVNVVVEDACGPRIAALSAEIERHRAEACALEHYLDGSGSEAWTVDRVLSHPFDEILEFKKGAFE